MCGSKLLFFCTSRGFADGPAGAVVVASLPPPVIGISHTTVPGSAPCRVLSLPSAPTTSTRPRTVVVVTCDVACACNPVAPAHNIAIQINNLILLSLIVDGSSLTARHFRRLLARASYCAVSIHLLKKELPS